MSNNPWEDYQPVALAEETGPWSEYNAEPVAVPSEEHPISTAYPRTRQAELRQAPEPTVWDSLKSIFDDPKKESAKAIEALVNQKLLKERTGLDVSLTTVYEWGGGVNRLLDMEPDRQEDRKQSMNAIKTFNDTRVEDGWLSNTWKSVKTVPINLQISAGGLLQMIEEGIGDSGQDMWLQGADATRASKLFGPLSMSESEAAIKAAFNKREEKEVRTLGGAIVASGREKLRENAALVEPGSWKELVGNSVTSAANSLLWLGVAIVTKKPYLAVVGISAQSTGKQYPELIDADINPLAATIGAVIYGAAEGVPELAPLSIYMNIGKGAGTRTVKGFAKEFTKGVLAAEFAEIPTEVATTITQAVVDKVTLNPDMTVRDAMSRITNTIYTTAFTTVGITSASHTMNKMIARDLPLQMKEPFNAAVKDTLDNNGTPQEAVVAGLEAVKATPEGAAHIDTVMAKFNEEAARIAAEEPSAPEAEVVEPISPEEEALTIPEDMDEDAILSLMAEGVDLEAMTDEDIESKTGVYEQEAAPVEGTPTLATTPLEDTGQAVEPIAVDPSVRSIVDDVARQLEATGKFTAEDAGMQAQVFGKTIRVMAKRAGIDPEKLYKKYGVNIGTGFEATPLKQGKGKRRIMSLSEYVRAAGGISMKKEYLKGEVRRFAGKGGATLINNKRGYDFDRWTEKVWGDYFYERPTIDEFIEALESDMMAKQEGKGRRLYPLSEADAVSEADVERQYAEYLEEQRLRNKKQAEPSDFLTKEEYFQKKGGPARGRIAFTSEGINIELLQNADRSTFLHELGHFYLKMLEDLSTMEGAKKDIAADYKTIRDWLGAKKGEAITVKQHEKFARGFEAYLMEGKAPSSQLKAAFEKFASWLTEIYKTLTALNVKLTPEVRDVMDRMIADRAELKAKAEGEVQTSEAISQAEGLRSVLPRKAVKGQIARTTGMKKVVQMIGEDEALSAAWKKAEQNARIAFRAEKKEAVEAAKAEMREIVAKVKEKAEAKIAKILTEKQKMARRRQSISNIQDYLGLTASNMKTMQKRQALVYPYKSDISQMTDYEFKVYQDNLLQLSVEVQEEAFHKARVAHAIESLHLQKVDNYREALGLPVVSEMTIDQLDAFADMLEQFQYGDVFLGQREIETVDRTPLKGIRTWREAKEALAKELNVPIEKLEAIQVSELDQVRWDTALAERNPFYGLLVESMTKSLMTAEAIAHDIENKVHDLAKKAEKSRKRTLAERAIPQDTQIIAYLEAPAEMKEAHLAEMTPEQIDLAHFMKQYYSEYLEYLIQTDSLEKGRENYFVHIRRSFFETLKEDGPSKAIMSIFKNYEQDQMGFTILNDKTGTILPLEKFFQYSMRRTGELDPSQNAVRSFLTYVRTAEKKRALDAIMPMLDIYAQAISPTKMTPRGLEMDTTLKDFVYKYINNKKGRQLSFGGVIPQGGKVDLSIRFLRAFTTVLDLGFSPITGSAAFVGEQVATFTMLGAKGHALGTARIKTAKGKAILSKYEHFVGRSAWEEFNLPGKEVGERLMEGMFGLFHASTVLANKQFLLASISEQEYNIGEISPERLAQMKLEMGRFRVVPGTKSLVGSTSIGSMFTQYKTWAMPIARSLVQDAGKLAVDLKNKPFREALTTREARELFRLVVTSATVLIVLGMGDEKDKTFVGRLSYKLRSEALTLLSSLDPTLWTTVPRAWTFVSQLAKNLKELAFLEEYKTKPGLKGAEGLKKQFTPGALRGIVGNTEDKPIVRR